MEDIISFINEKRSKGHEVLLAFDGNDIIQSMAIQRNGHECGLYDMLAIPGGDTDTQLRDTFVRGKQQRINHVLGSQWFVDAQRHLGALEFNNGIVSDHRGLFINFELKILFVGQMKGNFNVTTRGCIHIKE